MWHLFLSVDIREAATVMQRMQECDVLFELLHQAAKEVWILQHAQHPVHTYISSASVLNRKLPLQVHQPKQRLPTNPKRQRQRSPQASAHRLRVQREEQCRQDRGAEVHCL